MNNNNKRNGYVSAITDGSNVNNIVDMTKSIFSSYVTRGDRLRDSGQ